MKQLLFDTGEIELEVNHSGRVFRFNPTDASVYEGFFRLTEDIASKMTEYEAKELELAGKEESDPDNKEKYARDLVSLFAEEDRYLRESFDGVFGEGSADAVFGHISTISLCTNGERIFVNALTAIMPHFKTEAERRQKKIEKIIKESK